MVHQPTVFSTPKGNFLAGEKGKYEPELIVDGAAFKQINPDIKSSFMREIARVKGFEAGLYPTQKGATGSLESANESSLVATNSNGEIAAALNRAAAIFEKLEVNGLTAVLQNDLRTMKNLQKELDKFQALKNKNIR